MKQTVKVNHPKTRRFKLNVNALETLDDIKKILEVLDLRVQSNDPLYEELWPYFSIECVPRGYIKLHDKIGDEEISKLHYHEIERECKKLLEDENL
jgi:hypothetical protein